MEATLVKKPVRVRLGPSPTGPLHIGTARTALCNWLFAKHTGGTFVLRIEDTDKERSEKKYETELFEGLSWLGFDWDEGPADIGQKEKGAYGPYRQSERIAIYKKYLEQLLASGAAYYCYCTKEDLEAQRQAMLVQGLPPKYSGHCRNRTAPPEGKKPEVIRFKVPEVKVEFKDLVRGKVVFDAALFGDIVIAKDLDTPLYNFAVVVDDELMAITHVIRGEDHLSNTPKQILMQKALGFGQPIYAHIPLVLNADRSKMSKRFNDVALSDYRDRGYLPEALVNFLALLGWHPKDNKEVLSFNELIAQFDIDRVQQAAAIFNEEKLDWLNREYMKLLPLAELVARAKPFFEKAGIAVNDTALLEKMVKLQLSRAKTLGDFAEAGKFFFVLPDYDAKLLAWKDAPLAETKIALSDACAALSALPAEKFQREFFLAALAPLIDKQGRGPIFWPLRAALSGQSASPDPMEIMETLGRDESLRRINLAIAKL
jgi:glutamyl-tRNA synthetase